MVMLSKLYKFSEGIFCGCLVCFLVVGCGGKADTPEKQKQTQEIVRQKIPATEPASEVAMVTEQQSQSLPDSAGEAVPGQLEEKVGQPTPPAAENEQALPSAAQETTAVSDGQPETVSEGAAEQRATEEKQAEIDAITREAESVIGAEKTAENVQQEEATMALAEPVGPLSEDTQDSAAVLTPDDETTSEPVAPVIDFGLKEASEDGSVLTDTEEETTDELFNPFAPLFQKEKIGVSVTDSPSLREQRKFLTPLEKIDIGQLTLTGVIQAQSGNRALVTDAGGKGYVVKSGTFVGLNSGTVEKIETDRIVIVENIGSRQSKTVLKLQKPAGE